MGVNCLLRTDELLVRAHVQMSESLFGVIPSPLPSSLSRRPCSGRWKLVAATSYEQKATSLSALCEQGLADPKSLTLL